jgi:hypothetical protein
LQAEQAQNTSGYTPGLALPPETPSISIPAAAAQGFQKEQGNRCQQQKVQTTSELVSGDYACRPAG